MFKFGFNSKTLILLVRHYKTPAPSKPVGCDLSEWCFVVIAKYGFSQGTNNLYQIRKPRKLSQGT